MKCRNKSTQSALYFAFCFILIPCLGIKIQIWRPSFWNALCT
jgi:hypothetical protein